MKKYHKWFGLAALIPPLAMIFVDQSVLPVALPTIQQQLHASDVELEWSVNSYLLVTAVLVLAGGKLGDRIGYRRAFTWGMIIFALASALCGMAPTSLFLILARGLQGVGAALMFPASSALLMSLFPQQERGRAAGINVSVSALFLIIGPLIGGYLTEAFSWRWIFWINLPIAVLGFLLVFFFIPKSGTGKQKFDFLGFLYFALACTLLVTGLMQGREWGWFSWKIGVLLIGVVISTILLFWREQIAKHPFLDLSLFKYRVYRAVNISVFSTQFILMINVYRAIFFQNILGWSPLKTGVITVITSIPVLFMSLVGGLLADRYGARLPIAIGFSLLIYSFFWIGFFLQSPLPILFVGLLAFSFGVPLIFTPSYASAMNVIPPQKAGIAFGTISTIRSLSASIGVAAIGAFINNVEIFSFNQLIQQNPITKIEESKLSDGIVTGVINAETVKQIFPETADLLLGYAKEAQTAALFYSHIAIGCLLILAFSIIFVLYNNKNGPHPLPESPAEGWD